MQALRRHTAQAALAAALALIGFTSPGDLRAQAGAGTAGGAAGALTTVTPITPAGGTIGTSGAGAGLGSAGLNLPGGTGAGGLPGGAGMGTTGLPGIQGLPGMQGIPGSAGSAVGAGAQAQNIRADLGAAPALGVTQFQRFVQEATGKALPLFGYNLFDRSRFPSLNEAPVPATYLVGPGDELDIKIWGGVDFAVRLPVDRQGQITIPRVGPVSVTGVPAGELDAHLKKQLSRVYANFDVSATVGKLRSIQIFVVGQARNPGAYTVSSLSTLVSAVFESGGPAATGSMRKIDLVRSGRTVATLDLYQFILAGQTTGDARLLPGDVIVMRPAGPRVALTGALDNPAIFELASEQEPISQVLSYSGSSTTLTTPHKALVERVDNQKAKGSREVQERALNESGLKSSLRDGDVVTLLSITPEFSNAITLRGNVARPLRHAFRAGMKVSDLIPEPDALIVDDYYAKKNSLVQFESGRNVSLERAVSEARTTLAEINWDYASIERLDAGEVKTRLIPFNLGQAVRNKNPEHNLVLQPGDVVTIFSVNDIPVPREKRSRFVKLGGEVKVPGIYQVGANETLSQLVQRAGGLAEDAYLYGTVLTRESTRTQQQANLDQAIRRLEAQVNSQASAALQSATDAEKGQLAQAQVAAQRASLDRLRSLKASGRIALELDPIAPVLPRIVLEDRDEITVPARPSFVSVFGAVLAESTFIHRSGSTVKDYLERAGLTRDADLEAVMLVRSDGTVLSNGAQRSWLGLGQGSFMSTRVYPGDSVFVPEVLDKRSPYTVFIQGVKDWTQLFYQFGLGAAAVKTLRN